MVSQLRHAPHWTGIRSDPSEGGMVASQSELASRTAPASSLLAHRPRRRCRDAFARGRPSERATSAAVAQYARLGRTGASFREEGAREASAMWLGWTIAAGCITAAISPSACLHVAGIAGRTRQVAATGPTSVALARDGFVVSDGLARSLKRSAPDAELPGVSCAVHEERRRAKPATG
jgi:hypothetical protein